MKRIFTLTVLMTAFVLNVAAWEPVIKETHWFGMHEYYGNAPIVGVTTESMDSYLDNVGFTNNDDGVLWGWTKTISTGNTTYDLGNGKIGSYAISDFNSASVNWSHSSDDWCIGISTRWGTNSASYTQTKNLPKGKYKLTYDVQNVNTNTYYYDDNTHEYHPYINLFYVKVGEATNLDTSTGWMEGGTDWTTHTIIFTVNDDNSDVTISLGYGSNGSEKSKSPALYVSKLHLEYVDDGSIKNEGISNINWIIENSQNYIESITVVREWTGKTPPQAPKTSFYSWIDHKLRFSVGNTNRWGLAKGDGGEHYDWNGLGLCNTSNDFNFFYIHDLKVGDQISVEYYVDKTVDYFDNNNNRDFIFVYDTSGGDAATGRLEGISQPENANSKQAYRVTDAGNVRFNVGKKIIIRSVTIIHASANYKKATYRIDKITDNQSIIGYKYTLTNSGVLEDHRGAVPYITMRFGAENDMTFVRKLGDGEYAASSIIDESNDFNRTSARFQSAYQGLDEAQAKDRLANKEWTVFSTDLVNGEDVFSSILPEYGTYYYFFPEVNGKLSVKFYCEGAQEHMPFWFKSKDGVVVDFLKAGQDTDGSNYYEYNDIEVEKGAVYYLCANPTIIQHEHPIVRLISYSFIPTFRVDPLYKVVENGTESVTGAATIKGVTISEFTGTSAGYVFDNDAQITINGENAPMIKFLGNVKKDGTVIKLSQNGDDVKLDFTNIAYKSGDNINKGGAIVVNLDCPAGKATFVLTVAYNAAEAGMDNGVRVRADKTNNPNLKKWDFFTNELEIGQYKNGSGTYPSSAWTNSPTLYKEVHKADGLTADWLKTYVTLKDGGTGIEPIFKSVYDMEGDNADMIHETAGLIFETESNLLGIYNENGAPSSNSFNDRYIGLMGPKELPLEHENHKHNRALIVPLLKANDRIVIKMGCYGNLPGDTVQTRTAKLKLTNAKDAVGNTISEDYIIGGSGSESGNFRNGVTIDLSKPYGEYHFIVAADGDFKLEVNEADLLKIYSIEIYRNADNNNASILSENNILGENREILYTDRDGGATKQMNISLHHFGLGERCAYLSTSDSSYGTGSFMSTTPSFTADANNLHFTYTPSHNMFGSFRARLGVKTKDQRYVTDYADYSMAVGYRETKTYPYTWDFTDLKKYTLLNANGNESAVSNADLRVWSGYGMRVQSDNCDKGTLFVSGSQLYAGTTMFEETKGIGIDHYNNDSRRNGVMTMTGDENGENGGLKVNDSRANGEKPLFYGFIVPEVAANNAIYVRATKANEAKTSQAKYKIGNGNETAFTYTGTAGGDDIFAMQMASNASTADVKLCFQGYEVKRIAVATDAKTVNKYGWNTESREHPIDPSLLPYMTGKDFRTYIVTEANEENNTVTLARIDGGSANGDNANMKLIVPGATKVENEVTVPDNGSINACIIRYVDDTVAEDAKEVNLFGDGSGFHLFVPDMHDAASTIPPTNLLKARVTATTDNDKVARDETVESKTFNNYAFTYKYRKVNDNGDPYTDQKEGVQAFYRIVSGGARSGGHQAYLSIEAPAASRASSRAAASSQSAEHYDILFQEWDNIEQMKGDVNGDGRFNKLDVNTMADYVAGRPTGIFKGLADMNDDGNVDIVDMTLMIKKITGE